jgi:hypothetical protein
MDPKDSSFCKLMAADDERMESGDCLELHNLSRTTQEDFFPGLRCAFYRMLDEYGKHHTWLHKADKPSSSGEKFLDRYVALIEAAFKQAA